jgi:hypothetical protein
MNTTPNTFPKIDRNLPDDQLCIAVFKALVDQGGPSINYTVSGSMGGCCYRGNDDPTSNIACAFGLMISNPEFERLDSEDARGAFAERACDILNIPYRDIYNTLQAAHDDAARDFVSYKKGMWIDCLTAQYRLRKLPYKEQSPP